MTIMSVALPFSPSLTKNAIFPFSVPIGYIKELPDQRYYLLQQIPVHFREEEKNIYVACFREASICMSGESIEEAKESLAYDIVEAWELLLEKEDKLGAELRRNLAVLRRYVCARD